MGGTAFSISRNEHRNFGFWFFLLHFFFFFSSSVGLNINPVWYCAQDLRFKILCSLRDVETDGILHECCLEPLLFQMSSAFFRFIISRGDQKVRTRYLTTFFFFVLSSGADILQWVSRRYLHQQLPSFFFLRPSFFFASCLSVFCCTKKTAPSTPPYPLAQRFGEIFGIYLIVAVVRQTVVCLFQGG